MLSFSPLALIRLMRPHQWLKNAFVLAGLAFSQTWRYPAILDRVLIAFVAFCCISSMVYILNDLHDRSSDALHPDKKRRPLASGAVSVTQALILAAALLAAGLWLTWGMRALMFLLGWYVLLNIAYSWRLKQVPVVDVSIIATGFMLRLLAGTWAVGIPPSRWLVLAGIFIALFLGFSKRKAETFHATANQRAVLAHYPPALLDTFIAVTMTAVLTTYSLFASSPEAQLQHGEQLLYTVPVVIFGMLRYTYQVHRGRGEDVARDLVRDPWIVAAGVVYVAIFMSRGLW
ncbi:MAG: decaprenyl-phosphate phosphoribosyltransferase [Pseudomonadota bacterium]